MESRKRSAYRPASCVVASDRGRSYDRFGMPRLRLLLGPAGSLKGRIVRERLWEAVGQGRGEELFCLVPYASYSSGLRREALERKGGFFSFPVMTFGLLFERLFLWLRDDRALISEPMRRAVITALLKQAHNRLNLVVLKRLGARPGVARRLGDVFLTLASHSYLGAEQVREALALRGSSLPVKVEELLELYQRYRRVLEEVRLVDSAQMGAIVCDALERGERRLVERLAQIELLIVDGFYSFTPLEERLLSLLIKSVGETWVSLDIELDGSEEVFALPRRTLKFLRSTLPDAQVQTEWFEADEPGSTSRALSRAIYTDSGSPGGSGPLEPIAQSGLATDLSIVEAADLTEEVRGIARAIKRLVARGESGLERIVVSFPDISRYRDELVTRFEEYGVPIDVSWAFFISETLAVRSVFRLLAMVRDGFRRDDVLWFLGCPVFRPEGVAGRTKGARRPRLDPAFIDDLTRQGRISGGGREWLEEWRRGLKRARQRIEEKSQRETADGGEDDRAGRLLEEFEIQAPALVEVLSVLASRFGGRVAPEKLHEALLRTLSEMCVVSSAVRARVSSGEEERVMLEMYSLSRLVGISQEVCRAVRACGFLQVDLATYYDLLFSACSGERVGWRGRPGGVRLLPLREARLSDCDFLFCGGMTEDWFPSPSRSDVFLPPEVREALGLGPLGEEVQESRFLIYALLATPARRLFLSFPARIDEQPVLPAPCIDELQEVGGLKLEKWAEAEAETTSPHCNVELFAALGRWFREGQADERLRGQALWLCSSGQGPGLAATPQGIIRRIEAQVERDRPHCRFSGCLGRPVMEQVLRGFADAQLSSAKPAEVLVFSYSALDDFLACPFRFFARRILRLVPPEEFDPDIAAKDLGSLLHAILFAFYQSRRKEPGTIEPVTESNLESAWAKLDAVARDQIERYAASGIARRRAVSVLLGDSGLLRRFLELEVEESRRWRPFMLEASFGSQDRAKKAEQLSDEPLLFECKGGEKRFLVAVGGRIDRIDVSTDEQGGRVYRVLDYKTGSIPTAKEVREGISLQLPIYAYAVQERLGTVSQAAYLVLSQKKGLKIADYPRADPIPEAVEKLPSNVCLVVERICSGEFVPQPEGGEQRQCRWCDFRSICRLGREGL